MARIKDITDVASFPEFFSSTAVPPGWVSTMQVASYTCPSIITHKLSRVVCFWTSEYGINLGEFGLDSASSSFLESSWAVFLLAATCHRAFNPIHSKDQEDIVHK